MPDANVGAANNAILLQVHGSEINKSLSMFPKPMPRFGSQEIPISIPGFQLFHCPNLGYYFS